MTKTEAYREAEKRDAGFIANVILHQHSRPAKKLKGLIELLQRGHEVRTGQFDMDILVIDGRRYGWEVLESPGIVKVFAPFAQKEVTDA